MSGLWVGSTPTARGTTNLVPVWMEEGVSNYETQEPCLRCDKMIRSHEWDIRNGVCADCEPLTEIPAYVKEKMDDAAARRES